MNQLTTALIEDQIRAKNAILEAVGVCERKDKTDSITQGQKSTLDPAQWSALSVAEEDCAANLYFMGVTRGILATWWVDALRRRILVSPFVVRLVSC
jgi:hypothetical protein